MLAVSGPHAWYLQIFFENLILRSLSYYGRHGSMRSLLKSQVWKHKGIGLSFFITIIGTH